MVEELCQSLRAKHLLEDWQLTALDSAQWERLGAPIGLAAAIRHLSTTVPSLRFAWRDARHAFLPRQARLLTKGRQAEHPMRDVAPPRAQA